MDRVGKMVLQKRDESIFSEARPERILVVDDEEAVREIVVSMLNASGYRCSAVAGGVQALELLDCNEGFDLVTSDLENVHMGGFQLLEQIKRAFPEIPVLIISAAETWDALECLRHGAYDYLLKPFERDQLIFAVRRALESRRLKLANRALQTKLAELEKSLTDSRLETNAEDNAA
jgi:DNA-binding NtrC family response regulator